MVRLKRWRLVMTAVLGLFFCCFGRESLASVSDLPPGVIVGDDSGIKVADDGKYFIEHTQIQPGITFKKEITISNYSQEADPFELRLDMKSESVSGELNLLEAITVTLVLEGETIYQGPLSGNVATSTKTAKTKTTTPFPLYLGEYGVGETKVLTATFKVAADLPKEKWQQTSEADFYWVFYATKEQEPQPKPKPKPKPSPFPLPKTGEEWSFVIMGIIIGVVVVMISLIVAKKRHRPHL